MGSFAIFRNQHFLCGDFLWLAAASLPMPPISFAFPFDAWACPPNGFTKCNTDLANFDPQISPRHRLANGRIECDVGDSALIIAAHTEHKWKDCVGKTEFANRVRQKSTEYPSAHPRSTTMSTSRRARGVFLSARILIISPAPQNITNAFSVVYRNWVQSIQRLTVALQYRSFTHMSPPLLLC